MALLTEVARALVGSGELPDVDVAVEAATAGNLLLMYIAEHRRRQGRTGADDWAGMVAAAQLRVMERRQVLHGIKQVLSRAGVRWVVMKGPVLAARFYPVEWAREYNDIDIVVHPDDLRLAVDTLCAADAVLLDRNWAMIAAKRQGEISLTWGSHLIDLHWHFYSAPTTRQLCCVDMRAVIGRRRELTVAGMVMPVMDDLDGLVFLATHAILSGGHRARWMVDFLFAYRGIEPEPAALFARARQNDAALQLAVMVQRVEKSLAAVIFDPRPFLLPTERAWFALCDLTGRVAPVENDLSGGLSGRAVFSASRGTPRASTVALLGNLWDAARRRLSRRMGGTADLLLLHGEGGTTTDRDRWFADAALERFARS